MHRQTGVTLVELLVVLAIIGIVVGIGVPAWSTIARTNHLAAITNRLVGAIHLARAEAIRSGRRVTLCASRDGATCTTEGYQVGWIVFRDLDGDTRKDLLEPVLARGAADHTVVIQGNRPVARMISYTPMGVPKTATGAFQAGTLYLCADGDGRRIVLSRSGRLRVETARCGEGASG